MDGWLNHLVAIAPDLAGAAVRFDLPGILRLLLFPHHAPSRYAYRHTVEIKNEGETDLQLLLEPWPELFIIRPGETYTLVGAGPKAGTWEIERQPGQVVVYPWVEARSFIYHAGKLVNHDTKAYWRHATNGVSTF